MKSEIWKLFAVRPTDGTQRRQQSREQLLSKSQAHILSSKVIHSRFDSHKHTHIMKGRHSAYNISKALRQLCEYSTDMFYFFAEQMTVDLFRHNTDVNGSVNYDSNPLITSTSIHNGTLRIKNYYERSEVFASVKIQVEVFWFVTPCSIVVGYQRFRGPWCLHLLGCDAV
jgi:hypothetical protein